MNLLKNYFFSLLGGVLLMSTYSIASIYYVATDGNDKNNGTIENPFATLNKANKVVEAGDTVWIRGGVYNIQDTVYVKDHFQSAGIYLNKSGESDDKPICYFAYPKEKPIFDFTGLLVGIAYENTGEKWGVDSIQYTSGFFIEAKYLHLKGFEVKNVPMKHNSNYGVLLYSSSHIRLEQINSHHNNGPGFFVQAGLGGHLFLNCDSHDNYDPKGRQGDGENADGFGIHYQSKGDTSRFVGCRSWWNSDDGYDFFAQEFPVIIENSYAMGNGTRYFGTENAGNGEGFKMGPSRNKVGSHTIKNSVAWNNKSIGFSANYTAVGSKWYNNTAYNNGYNNYDLASTTWDENKQRIDPVADLTGNDVHIMKNNLAYPKTLSRADPEHNTINQNNSWNLETEISDKDFVSLEDPSLTITGEDLSIIPGMLGPRKEDGNLPDVNFLRLKSTSPLVDAGVNIGDAYEGIAPDIGAFEFSANFTTNIYKPIINNSGKNTGIAKVFDLQGRFMGDLYINMQNKSSIKNELINKVKKPGVFIVKWNNQLQTIKLK